MYLTFPTRVTQNDHGMHRIYPSSNMAFSNQHFRNSLFIIGLVITTPILTSVSLLLYLLPNNLTPTHRRAKDLPIWPQTSAGGTCAPSKKCLLLNPNLQLGAKIVFPQPYTGGTCTTPSKNFLPLGALCPHPAMPPRVTLSLNWTHIWYQSLMKGI